MPPPARVALSALADLALITLFVAIGRRSHDEDGALLGFLTTLWPFVVGAAIGWLVVAVARRRMWRVWPAGVVVWGCAVLGGMLLRAASGQGVQPSFVIVTAVVLAAFLVGWRAIAVLVARMRGRRSAL